MIKKVLLTLSVASLFGTTTQAQTINPCGTSEAQQKLMALHPEIAEKDAALSQEIATKLSKMSLKDLSRFAKTTDDGTTMYDVPIVFHIVHDYGAEYVTDAAIAQCVSDVNKMYNKQNADTVDVIPPYKGYINNSKTWYIGKARITWHLATIDPNGKPTNGITRRRVYTTKFAGDLAKFDQWPPNNYMNVWVVNTMSSDHSSAAAYAYKPATGDVIPYYDGVIALYSYINYDNTIAHELGHELNLSHPWGDTNNPAIACGDDEVDDTPITKGHDPAGGCSDLADIYDTACLYSYNQPVGKLRLDSTKRAVDSTVLIFSDTSTSKGISFQCRTATQITSLSFYPTAAIGSTYIIGLSRNGILIDTAIVRTTVTSALQTISHVFKVPIGDTGTKYKLFFVQNKGALRDTVTPSVSKYPSGVPGTIYLKQTSDDNYYNFFYDVRMKYGYFKIYGADSLVDFPDTTNSQNVMDYTYCSKMFTAGQVERMRAALTSTTAKRSNLITPENLARTGALATSVSLAPKAEFSVEKGVTSSGISLPATTEASYFLCSDAATTTFFKFKDRSWRATATSTTWNMTNGATVVTTGTGNAYKFSTPGWATIQMVASNAVGADTFTSFVNGARYGDSATTQSIYVADPNAINPIGFWQDFTDATENARWPIFNYYNNRYKWEITNAGGTYDNASIRYRSYDNRVFPESIVGDPTGDYDDFFTPAFDLSTLGAVNGNLNFMYAGAYATNNPDLMKDTMEIAYSTNCGASWTNLKIMGGSQMQTVGSVPATIEYTPKWNDWKPMSIDLKSGTSTIRGTRVFFRFRYRPSARTVSGTYKYAAGNNFYIDRFNISDNPLSVNEMILGNKMAAVAPNPTTANAFVLLSKANAHVQVQVMDITGKVVYTTTQAVNQANARIEIPANNIAAKGIYLVHITGDDNLNQTEKLIVY